MSLDFGSSDTRRLPVYFLICVGDNMAGQPIQTVEAGLHALQRDLLMQPQAVEQVWTSIITYATQAQQLVSLGPINQVSVPKLFSSGAANLGKGLELLVQALRREIVPSSSTTKGDYRPLVFLLLDGEPTDRWEQQIVALEKARNDRLLGTLIGVGIGAHANLGVLRQLTESVLWMKELKQEALYSLFQWTSTSVNTVSQGVSLFPEHHVTSLPKPPDGSEVII